MNNTPAAAPTHSLDNRLVLSGRPLRPETSLLDTSRFRDDQWDLGPALLQRQVPRKVLDFTAIPLPHRLTAKELCYAMLSGHLPPGEVRLSASSVKRVLTSIARFLNWIENRPALPRGSAPIRRLVDLGGTDMLDFQRSLIEARLAPTNRNDIRSAVRLFWRYRESLTSDRLPFDPRYLEGWGERGGAGSLENRTARIPEEVLGPLLVWSMRFVDDFADDILGAVDFWHTHRNAQVRPDRPASEAGASLRAFLDTQIARGTPLPGRNGEINILFMSVLAGCSRRHLARHRHEIEQAAEVVGVGDDSRIPTPVSGRLDGHPWIEAVTTNGTSPSGLGVLARTLQAACYVVIAFLSGMRDSEVKHLRRGCLQTLRDPDGQPYRQLVTSTAFKGERAPAGVTATWIVGAPAARAIEVLHRLQIPTASLLFAALPTTPGGKMHSRRPDTAISYGTTNVQLAALIRWVNDYCAATDRPDSIPEVNGGPPHLTTRQFRRTLAWFIARRPGGVIAGAIAYRHHAISMFEGYAGTSDSGFRAEVESEQALARGEGLLAMIDAHQHDQLTGPAADEGARRLTHLATRARFQGVVVTDERRLERLMRRDDPAIYPDHYVTCVHKHATALCQQQRDTAGRLRPQLNGCRPLSCRNVALTSDNLAAWRAELDHIDRELAIRPTLAPLLSHQLRSRRGEITAFLERHTGHQPP